MSFSDKAFHASGDTIKIAASTASTNMALGITGATPQVSISNASASWASVVFGDVTATSTFPTTAAAAPGYMIAPGVERVVTPGGATYMAVSLSSGTGSIYATPGEGR